MREIKYFKDSHYQVFHVELNAENEIQEGIVQEDWVEIDQEEALYLATAPSIYHELINGKWAIKKEKQEQKHQDIISQNTVQRAQLIKEATTEIDTLQDEIDLEMSDDIEATEKSLKDWKKYRVLLNKLDITQEDLIFPTKPE